MKNLQMKITILLILFFFDDIVLTNTTEVLKDIEFHLNEKFDLIAFQIKVLININGSSIINHQK